MATIGSRSAGDSRFSDDGAGAGACTICSATADRVAPVKGGLPVSISNMTMPSEKRSVRESTGSPRACSGDMQATVPCSVPAVATVVDPGCAM